jgi:hypothetical protein
VTAVTIRFGVNPSSCGSSASLRRTKNVVSPADAAQLTSHELEETNPRPLTGTLSLKGASP